MSRHRGYRLAFGLAVQSTRRALATPGAARMLIAALIVAVAAVTAVTRLTDRVDAAIVTQAAQTLGGDLALELEDAPSARQRELIDNAGVTTARNTQLTSALAVDDRLLRVSIQAVSKQYPLDGQITLRRGDQTIDVAHGPPPGRIWIDAAVAARLGVAVGQSLDVGRRSLIVDAELVADPGGGARLFDTAPRVMMARSDLAATGLVGPGARLEEVVLIDGPPNVIRDLRERLTPTLVAGERLVDPAGSNRGLSAAMDKADVFLNLAALAAVILAGVAIALSAHRHAEAQRDTIALYKTLGAARGVLRRMLAGQLIGLGLIGLLVGVAVGELAAFGLVRLVDTLFAVALPSGHLLATWPAIGVAAVLLAGFAWPAQRSALTTPPARVLARSRDTAHRARWPIYLIALAAVVGMAIAATGDIALTGWVMASLAGATLAFALAVHGVLYGLAWLLRRFDDRLPASLRMGLDGVLRRQAIVRVQSVALALGLTVIFVLVVVRGDLLSDWQTRVADDAPNRFVINVTGDQRQAIAETLTNANVERPTFYPIVRARLTTVDGRSVDDDAELRDNAGRLVKRALNLSWTESLKADNRIVEGRWWPKADPVKANDVQPLSIAESVARRLEIGIGATLGFDIAGQTLRGRVVSVRQIDWSSLQPNFFILTPPGVLDAYPASWITSFYLPAGHESTMTTLVRQFPNLNVIDIAAILARVQRLIERVSLAIELVFGFTLAAGLVVLAAAMGVHRDVRRREAAVLRALGATSQRLRRSAWSECLLIGLIAAVPAAIAAQIAARLIATYGLHVDYVLRPGVWLVAVTIAVLSIAAAGVAALGDVRRQPAWAALRAGG